MPSRFLTLLLATLFFAPGLAPAADLSPATVDQLRCEYRQNPMGLTVERPRMFWQMVDARRGAAQTAYQILVADDPKTLDAGEGNVWDTGRVESDQSIQIVYDGKPLASCKSYHWKVRIWDAEGKPTDYSQTATFRTGMFKPEDVKAKWIGPKKRLLHPQSKSGLQKMEGLTLDDCLWVWSNEPNMGPKLLIPSGKRYFRRDFDLPEGEKPEKAIMLLSVDNSAQVFLNGHEVFKGVTFKRIAPIDMTKHIKPGKNQLAILGENFHDTPNAAAVCGKLGVAYKDKVLLLPIDTTWQVAREVKEGWQTGPYGTDDKTVAWEPAAKIRKVGEEPWGKLIQPDASAYGAAQIRKEFSANGEVRRATVHASALGNYRLHINGQPVADDYFTPGWTDYNKRVYYNTYDVTDLVRSDGKNAVGVELAAGWYAGSIGWALKKDLYGKLCKAFVQLELEMADGSKQTVITDGSWKTAYGPRVEAEFLNGETYDARLETPGWSKPDFDDSAWNEVEAMEKIDRPFTGFPSQPVRVTGEIEPVSITEPKPGHFVFDLGQNFAGFCRLKVKGPAGTTVVLRHAEVLNPDGTIYTENLRLAKATDTYTLKGDPNGETWAPRFTFHGFRYVEMTGFPGRPTKENLTGLAVNSDVPMTGKFVCSSPMVNRLYQNILWTQRANFIEVPTDCPQRDERLGWTGDAQCFVYAASFNADIGAFFTKWLVDLEDAQQPDGSFTNIAPDPFGLGSGTAGWADAGTICPMTIYEVYHDRRVLEKHYDAMARFVDYCEKHSDHLIRPAQGYGDWLSIKADTPKEVMGTAYFAYSTKLTAEAAEILGKTEDAKRFGALFEKIKEAFNQKFVSEDGRIHGNTQTVYVLALAFDLLPEAKRELAAKHLAADIRARDNHLSTGFNGTAYLMPTLASIGEHDLATKLLLNETFPSWGFSIKHGATSIWERWDGWTPDKGFQSPSMNSFAHYSFGAVARWMFQSVAGIETKVPGYKRFVVQPQPRSGLDWVEADYDSIHGPIKSHWKKQDGRLTFEVTVPANTSATVTIPTTDAKGITEGGKPLAESGLKVTGTTDTSVTVDAPAGSYRFESAWK